MDNLLRIYSILTLFLNARLPFFISNPNRRYVTPFFFSETNSKQGESGDAAERGRGQQEARGASEPDHVPGDHTGDHGKNDRLERSCSHPVPSSSQPRPSLIGLVLNWATTHRKCLIFFNPFTPKSDQCQISPAASPEISYHTVWRTWLFIAYSDERWLSYQFSRPHLCIALWKVGRMHFFNLGVKGLRAEISGILVENPSHFWKWDGFSTKTIVLQCLQSLH